MLCRLFPLTYIRCDRIRHSGVAQTADGKEMWETLRLSLLKRVAVAGRIVSRDQVGAASGC